MGAEVSASQKNRTVSLCDDGMTLRVRNNYRPLRFHSVHGENVRLLKNGSVASRSEGFCKGIAFSDRPVLVGEPICIKFLEISSNWSGALRIGFTMNDPVSLKSKLPRYACPDLTSMQGNWAKAIAERMAKKDSVLYYYVDPSGDVHYGIDSEEHGVFFGGVNTSTKLWAVLDIYGNTVAVEFVGLSSVNPEYICDSSHSNNSTLSRTKEIQHSSVLNYEINRPLSFHPIHGKNVLLKTNRTTAERKPCFNSLAYVFTKNALKLEEAVVIEVRHINQKYDDSLVYGITSCNPNILSTNSLPENPDDLLDRPEYWVVENDPNVYEVGDTIAYSISSEGEVTVVKNYCHKSAVFHVDPTQPLWLFINVVGRISEINLLGSSLSDVDAPNIINQERMQVSLPSSIEKVGGMPGTSGQQACNECVVCYEEQVNCALYRCGHMCMCYDCATKMWKGGSNVQCPICREIIRDVIKIYR